MANTYIEYKFIFRFSTTYIHFLTFSMVFSEVYVLKSKEYAELIKNPNKKDAMRDQILDKLKYIP